MTSSVGIRAFFLWCAFAIQHCGSLITQRPAIDDAEARASVTIGKGFLKHHVAVSYQNSASRFGKIGEHDATHNICHKDMLAVCIMGQLSRLEVRSKIENLFQPEALRRTAVDVFVVLETDADFYVNPGSIKSSDNVCHTDFGSATDVENAFSPFYRTGLYVNPVTFNPNLDHWERYGSDKPENNASIRLSSHFSQWTHLSQCATLIKEQERITGCKYNGVVKMRDNTIVARPMHINIGSHVIVKACASWGGVNDKTFITPRHFLEGCFEGPLRTAMSVNRGAEHPHLFNPEMFLAYAFKRNGVKLARTTHENNTMVDGRCLGADGLGQRNWCLVSDHKDCHPSGKTFYASCS